MQLPTNDETIAEFGTFAYKSQRPQVNEELMRFTKGAAGDIDPLGVARYTSPPKSGG